MYERRHIYDVLIQTRHRNEVKAVMSLKFDQNKQYVECECQLFPTQTNKINNKNNKL